jgi:hypothetical protein
VHRGNLSFQPAQEPLAIHHLAAFDHHPDPSCVSDIFERIGIEDEEVRELAFFDRADVVRCAEDLGAWRCVSKARPKLGLLGSKPYEADNRADPYPLLLFQMSQCQRHPSSVRFQTTTYFPWSRTPSAP